MKGSRRFIPGAVICLIIGATTMSKFSAGVRTVAVVGLTGAGAAIAVGIALLVLTLKGGARQ